MYTILSVPLVGNYDSNRRRVTAMETVCVADKSKYPDRTILFPSSNVFDSFIASMIEQFDLF